MQKVLKERQRIASISKHFYATRPTANEGSRVISLGSAFHKNPSALGLAVRPAQPEARARATVAIKELFYVVLPKAFYHVGLLRNRRKKRSCSKCLSAQWNFAHYATP